jgi:hypothetical protein
MAGNASSVRLNYKGEPQGDLRLLLDQLGHVTVRLRSFGWFVAILTAMSLISVLSLGFFYRRLIPSVSHALLVGVGIALPLLSIACVLVFDSLRKKGDAFFKELSDELQWYVRYGAEEAASGVSEPTPSIRPDLRTRIALREYASSTLLPLLDSGASGPAIYAGANAALALIYLLLSSFRL